MKTFLKLVSIIFIYTIFISLSSCKKDDPDVVVDDRDVYVGTWNVSDEVISKQNYSVNIKIDNNNSTKVWLINFHGADSAFAYVNGNNISLPNQQIATGLIAQGSGNLVGTTKINWQYFVNSGADQDTISAVYLK